MGVVGVLGLVIYALLNMGTILGAKNTAMNTAHQRARSPCSTWFRICMGRFRCPHLRTWLATVSPSGDILSTVGSGSGASGEMKPNGGPHKIIEDEAARRGPHSHNRDKGPD